MGLGLEIERAPPAELNLCSPRQRLVVPLFAPELFNYSPRSGLRRRTSVVAADQGSVKGRESNVRRNL